MTPAPDHEPPVADFDVLVRRLDPLIPLPNYAQPGDAGADIVTRSI